MAKQTERGPRRHFGEIETLPSGRYRVRYTGPDMARHTRSFTTRMEGEGWLRDESRLIERDEWTPPKSRTAHAQLTVAGYAATNLKARTLAPRTREEYVRYLERFVIGHPLGRMTVRSVTPTDVVSWLGEVREATGKVYAARVYGFVSSVFKSAFRDGVIEVTPCRVVGASNAPRQTGKTSASPTEVDALLGALPSDTYRALVLVAAWGGLRSGELRNLRRRDVDLTAGTVTAREQVQQVRGQGKVVRELKTDAARREVHLPAHVVDVLRDQVTHRALWGRDGLVFPSTVGTPISQSVLWRAWDTARRSIDRPDLRFHDLRHTAAMLAAATGATVAELMARIGHATPGAAMDYQHAASGADARIAEALERLATSERTATVRSA